MDEPHITVDGQNLSGGIFDFGLYFFHNAKEAIARGHGPYFYLPKMEVSPSFLKVGERSCTDPVLCAALPRGSLVE